MWQDRVSEALRSMRGEYHLPSMLLLTGATRLLRMPFLRITTSVKNHIPLEFRNEPKGNSKSE